MCFERIHFMNLFKYFYYLNLMLPKEIINLILDFDDRYRKYKSENIKEFLDKIKLFKIRLLEDDEIYMYSEEELDSILSSNFPKFILKNRL